MIIDADRIKGGISPELISKLVNKYNSGTSRFKDLMKYYKGEHSILTRPNKSEGLPNTKIVCNHAKYIVDMTEVICSAHLWNTRLPTMLILTF